MGFVMALKSTLEQLEEVQTCISKIMSGVEVMVGGKRLRYSDLDALHRREQALLARYHRERGRGPAINTGIIKRD